MWRVGGQQGNPWPTAFPLLSTATSPPWRRLPSYKCPPFREFRPIDAYRNTRCTRCRRWSTRLAGAA